MKDLIEKFKKEVILVADSSKFKRRSLAFICPLSKINMVITDENISKEDLKKLQDVYEEVVVINQENHQLPDTIKILKLIADATQPVIIKDTHLAKITIANSALRKKLIN